MRRKHVLESKEVDACDTLIDWTIDNPDEKMLWAHGGRDAVLDMLNSLRHDIREAQQ
jgi:hypothetical protein